MILESKIGLNHASTLTNEASQLNLNDVDVSLKQHEASYQNPEHLSSNQYSQKLSVLSENPLFEQLIKHNAIQAAHGGGHKDYQRAVSDIGLINSSASYFQNRTPLSIQMKGIETQEEKDRSEIYRNDFSKGHSQQSLNPAITHIEQTPAFINASADKFRSRHSLCNFGASMIQPFDSELIQNQQQMLFHQNVSPLQKNLINLSQVFQPATSSSLSSFNLNNQNMKNSNGSPFSGLSAFKFVSQQQRHQEQDYGTKILILTRQNEQLRQLLKENQNFNEIALVYLQKICQMSIPPSPQLVPCANVESQETTMSIGNLQINRTPSFNQRNGTVMDIQSVIKISEKVQEMNKRFIQENQDDQAAAAYHLLKMSQNLSQNSSDKLQNKDPNKVILPNPSSTQMINEGLNQFQMSMISQRNIVFDNSIDNNIETSIKQVSIAANFSKIQTMSENCHLKNMVPKFVSNPQSLFEEVKNTQAPNIQAQPNADNMQYDHAIYTESLTENSDSSDSEASDSSSSSSSDEDYCHAENYQERWILNRARGGSVAKQQQVNKVAAMSKTITKDKPVIKKCKPSVPQNSLIANATSTEEQFICEKCGEQFTSGWALGGHASRVHPGESEAYRRKIQRRDERVFERELLSLAKEKHQEIYGIDAPINRVKIRKFKRELRTILLSQCNNNSGRVAARSLLRHRKSLLDQIPHQSALQ